MKPGVFTQLYIHLIFAVKYRERLLIEYEEKYLFEFFE